MKSIFTTIAKYLLIVLFVSYYVGGTAFTHTHYFPTYSITRDFDWSETKNNKLLFEMTAKFGTPYFSNYINSDMEPSDIRSMCCRLRLDLRELRKKSGGFGVGILALTGIIIRNSVILINQISQDIDAGEPLWDAIIDATVSRFRPITLTAAAAILGMLPLASSIFWGPMAITIAGGLFAATVLTLIVLPVMYATWYKAEPPHPDNE